MFEFAWPWVFLLLPLPWLVRRFTAAVETARQSSVMEVPFIESMERATAGSGFGKQGSAKLFWLAYLVWSLLVTAAASPQWLGEPIAQQLEGRDLVLAVDLSESMLEQDFVLNGQRVSRLAASRVVAGDFIERRHGDRIGLILFAEQAYLQSPLTHDRKTVQQLLGEAQVGLAGKATAIGDAIGLAVKRFQQDQAKQRILVLMTDGTNTAGLLTPEKATEIAAAEGLKVYTIGIGREARGGSLLGQFFTSAAPELDEKMLTYIAEQTGGRYFRAQDLDQLAQIYQQLDQLEPVEQEYDFYRPIDPIYHWPLLAALLISVMIALFREREV